MILLSLEKRMKVKDWAKPFLQTFVICIFTLHKTRYAWNKDMLHSA